MKRIWWGALALGVVLAGCSSGGGGGGTPAVQCGLTVTGNEVPAQGAQPSAIQVNVSPNGCAPARVQATVSDQATGATNNLSLAATGGGNFSGTLPLNFGAGDTISVVVTAVDANFNTIATASTFINPGGSTNGGNVGGGTTSAISPPPPPSFR